MVVAQAAINDSCVFIIELGNWITQEYQDMLGRGAESTEIWKLILHCVREVFAELNVAHILG